jgi:hypothetical protein
VKPNSFPARLLRFTGIFFMGLAVLVTLAGGIGTSCAAFNPTNPSWADSMGSLAPYQWLYIAYVLIGVAAGIWGIKALIGLIRGTTGSYREALIVLLVGGAAALAQVVSSRVIRGKSMPTDMRLYVTLVTLIIFLILRIPWVWRGVNFDRKQRGGSGTLAGGVTAIVMGFLTLTVQYWVGSTHLFSGTNFSDVWHLQLGVVGWSAVAAGTFFTAWSSLRLLWIRMRVNKASTLRARL